MFLRSVAAILARLLVAAYRSVLLQVSKEIQLCRLVGWRGRQVGPECEVETRRTWLPWTLTLGSDLSEMIEEFGWHAVEQVVTSLYSTVAAAAGVAVSCRMRAELMHASQGP